VISRSPWFFPIATPLMNQHTGGTRMKIILSRKGFDASYGGCPSPIFPDGTFCLLPIPDADFAQHNLRYQDVQWGDHPLGPLVQGLTQGKIRADRRVHLDPDLVSTSLPRMAGWQPLFGQWGAAEGHLQNQGVGAGDVFLFFGWFKAVEPVNHGYRYVKVAPDLHVLFGWLQIESRLPIAPEVQFPTWMQYHPHVQNRVHYSRNSLYLARPSLTLPHHHLTLPGAGVFRQVSQPLQLTAVGGPTRGLWALPSWFYPQGRGSTLSYHGAPHRWQLAQDAVYLKTVGRGQEFVLNCNHYPEAIDWLAHLFQGAENYPGE
jgi:hypothetical protein